MQEVALILSEYEEINSLLYKPIITTQRIKYTSFNVSTNYLVLGSTSGSLYLFTREPCIFQQLIPLSGGPVVHVLISPDEKAIALATKRGSVCIVNLKPSVKLLSISNEHEGEIVTCLCWNTKSTEIYVGDNKGKISTIVLSIFTVNGMFQAPSCALMHLDSSIVQIDFSMRYLLVSTLTRCYLCDTSQEQFKQIGNKARDGEFGACFLTSVVDGERKISSDDEMSNIAGGLNTIIGINEDLTEDQSLTIYCARPGSRLWEVTASGIVVKTHQFKEALAIPPSIIYQSSSTKCLNSSTVNHNHSLSINFSRLIATSQKFLLSYTPNGLYIIDPVNTAVILWTDQFNDVSMACVVDKKIYLMTSTGIFHCLMLSSVDYLILKLYEWKFYNDCLQLSKIFYGQLIEFNCNIDENLPNDSVKENINIVMLLQPVITALQPNVPSQPQRLNSGIVVVNSGNAKLLNDENNLFTSTVTNNYTKNDDLSESEVISHEKNSQIDEINSQIFDDITNKFTEINFNNKMNNLTKNNQEIFTNYQSEEIQIAISNIQFDLEPVNKLISTLKSSINSEELSEIICNIIKIISEVNKKYECINELKKFLFELVRSIERHYYQSLLEKISLDFLLINKNDCILNETLKAYIDFNLSNYFECNCGFPRQSDEKIEPKFHDVGRKLLEQLKEEEKCIELCKSVPLMWRDYLSIYLNNTKEKNVLDDDIIRLCLQTRDNIVLSIILPLLDSRQWKIVAECTKAMENALCLKCNIKLDHSTTNLTIDWSNLALEVVKKNGSDVALKVLFNLESVLPEIKLMNKVYQSLIFSKLLRQHGLDDHKVEFNRNKSCNNEYGSFCSPEVRKILAETLSKDLNQPVNENIFGNGPHHWGIRFKQKESTCPSCTLSLQTPVLLGSNGISIFPCGHAYHVNCLIEKKLTKCFLHSS